VLVLSTAPDSTSRSRVELTIANVGLHESESALRLPRAVAG
jgi:hypothetical protein